MSDPPPPRPSYDELAARVEEQDTVIAAMTAKAAEQDTVVAALQAEVSELRRRLGMNSSNSSKPPSSDGLDRSRGSSSSSGSSGKRGKPHGAPGATKRLVDNPDDTVACPPSTCGVCAHPLEGAEEFSRQRRQVFEVPPPHRRPTSPSTRWSPWCARTAGR